MWEQYKARYNGPWYDGCYFGPILLEEFTAIQPTNWEFRLKTSTAMDKFVRVSLFVTKALADKQEIIRRETWQDKNWLLLCCSWDLICLPLTGINGWEEATQKNTYGCKKNWTSTKQKMHNMHRTLAAHQSTPNVAVINYAEGSIVCFCLLLLLLLLLQIIERFKDAVGVESCELSFSFPCLLYLPVPTCVVVVFGFWSTSNSSPLLVCYSVHYSFSNQAIKTTNVCQSKHKPCSCQQLVMSILAVSAHQSAVIWHRLSFEPRRLNLQGRLCNRDSHFIGMRVSWWPRLWVKGWEIFWPRRSLASFWFSLTSWSTFCLKVRSCVLPK